MTLRREFDVLLEPLDRVVQRVDRRRRAAVEQVIAHPEEHDPSAHLDAELQSTLDQRLEVSLEVHGSSCNVVKESSSPARST